MNNSHKTAFLTGLVLIGMVSTSTAQIDSLDSSDIEQGIEKLNETVAENEEATEYAGNLTQARQRVAELQMQVKRLQNEVQRLNRRIDELENQRDTGNITDEVETPPQAEPPIGTVPPENEESGSNPPMPPRENTDDDDNSFEEQESERGNTPRDRAEKRQDAENSNRPGFVEGILSSIFG